MFCNYCGAENPEDALYCSTCGRPITRAAAPPQTSSGASSPTLEIATAKTETSVVKPAEHWEEPKPTPIEAPRMIEGRECPKCGSKATVMVEELADSDRWLCHSCGKKWRPGPADVARYGSMWERFTAYCADVVVIYLIVFGIYFVSGLVKRPLSGEGVESQGIYFMVLFAYMVVSQVAYHTTIGKYVRGLEVCSANPAQKYPSFGRILLRETVGRLVSSVLFGIGYWAADQRKRNQAWSDQMAGTVVVRNRPTHLGLKRALTAFVVVAFFADVGLVAWGLYYEDRTKRYQGLQKEMESAATQIESAREAVNQAMTAQAKDLETLRVNMRRALVEIDRYDQHLMRMKSLIDGALSANLSASGAERQQLEILQKVYPLRIEQSKKVREEANLILSYDPYLSDWNNLQSRLWLMDSDIAGLEHQASQLLAQIGKK